MRVSDIIESEFRRERLSESEYKKILIFLNTFPGWDIEFVNIEGYKEAVFNREKDSHTFLSFNIKNYELTVYVYIEPIMKNF